MSRLLYLLPAAMLLFSSCESDTRPDPEPVNMGLDYYPIAVGDYKVYQVMEARQIGPGLNPDTVTFQIRERVDSLFTDLSGEPYFRIIRSKRNLAGDTWADDSVIVVKKTSQRLERQENNVRQVKLVYPLALHKTWNGNQLNASPAETWHYTEIDVPYTLVRASGDTTFQKTLKVQQADEVNEVEVDKRWERYARQVGLIESYHFSQFSQQMGDTGAYVPQQAFTRHFKLLQHGHQ